MTSFFSGVKNWLFGESSQKQQQPGDNQDAQHTQHVGHKRDRSQQQHEPVLQEVRMHTGGIQGFKWFTSSLKVDADGDAAHGFICDEQHAAGQTASSTTAALAAAAAPGSSAQQQLGHGSSDSSSSKDTGGASVSQQQQQRFKLCGVQKGNLVVTNS